MQATEQKTASTLRKRQKLILLMCWLVYALAYLGRHNLSVALTTLDAAFGANKGLISMLGSMFYWCYAAGKLVNGYLGDYVNNKHMVFLGTVLSGLCNLVMGFAKLPWLLLLTWSLNGYIQSMLWCNMLCILSRWFAPQNRGRAFMILSTSMMAGSFGAYTSGGLLLKWLPYQWLFIIPGLALMIVGLAWALISGNDPATENLRIDNQPEHEGSTPLPAKAAPLLPFILTSGLLLVTAACLAQGMIKESISLWGPAMLEENFLLSPSTASSMLWALPLFNLGGVALVGTLHGRLKDEPLAALMMIACLVCLAGMWAFQEAVIYVVFLCILSGLMYGVNAVLTTLYPLRFLDDGRVSFTYGFLDASAYITAGLGSVLLAEILNRGFGWRGVYALWMIMALISLAFIAITARFMKKRRISRS